MIGNEKCLKREHDVLRAQKPQYSTCSSFVVVSDSLACRGPGNGDRVLKEPRRPVR